MNRGDTAYLMLNYTINGNPLVEGAYEEIELQLNPQLATFKQVKKLLSKGEIEWETMSYIDDEGHSQTFTGYIARLTQEETFLLNEGNVQAQLRILWGDDVGSSAISSFILGEVLSNEVLRDSA